MKYRVSRATLLKLIGEALQSGEDFNEFRSFVLNRYYAEDEYIFESEGIELIFDEVGAYLLDTEFAEDPFTSDRFRKLRKVFEAGGWTLEHVICALDYDRITTLLDKYRSSAISVSVFDDQIRKLSRADFDSSRLLEIYNQGIIT